MTPERREQVEEMFARYGNVIVFMGRHMAGLRAPIFAMAGHAPDAHHASSGSGMASVCA